jgi:hypothetical protein
MVELIQLVQKPDSNEIVERVLILPPTDYARSYENTYKVEGNQFQISERSGTFIGRGTLEGDPWRWKSWRSTTTTTTGKTAISEFALEGDVLTIKKTLRGAGGKLVAKAVGKYHRMSPEGFELIRTRLLHEVPGALSQEQLAHPIGIATASGQFTEVIPSGKQLPTVFSDSFTITDEDQSAVSVHLSQKRPEGIEKIAVIDLGIPRLKIGETACLLTLTVDERKQLRVKVRIAGREGFEEYGPYLVE